MNDEGASSIRPSLPFAIAVYSTNSLIVHYRDITSPVS
jgi:hypothetical protein